MIERLRISHNESLRRDFSLVSDNFGQRTINKNIKKDLSNWIKVASDIVEVEVNKTIDADYVLSFTDSKGHKASLWCSGKRLRAITPY